MHERPRKQLATFLFVAAVAMIAGCGDPPTTTVHGKAALRDCEPEDIFCEEEEDPPPDLDSIIQSRMGVKASFGRAEGDKAEQSAIGAHYARSSGAKWIRVTIAWNQMQPDSAGALAQSELDRYDPLIKAANDSGISVLVNLVGAPRWAQYCNAAGFRIPEDTIPCPNMFNSAPDAAYFDSFRAYVALLADRYDDSTEHGRVDYWEIFNEPDAAGFYEVPGNAMTKLESYAYAVQFAADALHPRGRKVVAPAVSSEPSGQSFLNMILTVHGSLIDVVSLHHYGTGAGLINHINTYAAGAALSSRPNLKIWVTEAGESLPTADDTAQAQNLTGIFSALANPGATEGRLEKVFYFSLDEFGGSELHRTLVRDMYTPSVQPRLAFYCMKALAFGQPLPQGCT